MAKKVDLRIGIISDPHLGFIGHINPNFYGLGQTPIGDQDKWWEYALRYFKSRKVDAIVVPGDMANACRYDPNDPMTGEEITADEMKRCGRIFREVFNGTDTQLICIYGNHDQKVHPLEKANGGELTPWEDAFNEPYTDYVYKKVQGFTFIGGHWGKEELCKDILKEEAEKNPNKPVFFIQHAAVKHTTLDSFEGAQLYDIGREMVKDYENIITLFGHTHSPITDERTIWQSTKEGEPKGTVISCGSLNYADSTGDLVRGDNTIMKHSLLLEVKGDDIRVERLSFFTPEMVSLARGEKTKQNLKKSVRSCGADWNFTLKGKEMDWDTRSSLAVAPEFPDGAYAGCARSTNFVEIHFPAALPLNVDNDLIHDYYAEAYEEETGELVCSNQIVTEYHVDHSQDFMSKFYQITLWNLKPDTKYEIRVYARDCWQKKSLKPIIYHGKTLKVNGDKLK